VWTTVTSQVALRPECHGINRIIIIMIIIPVFVFRPSDRSRRAQQAYDVFFSNFATQEKL